MGKDLDTHTERDTLTHSLTFPSSLPPSLPRQRLCAPQSGSVHCSGRADHWGDAQVRHSYETAGYTLELNPCPTRARLLILLTTVWCLLVEFSGAMEAAMTFFEGLCEDFCKAEAVGIDIALFFACFNCAMSRSTFPAGAALSGAVDFAQSRVDVGG